MQGMPFRHVLANSRAQWATATFLGLVLFLLFLWYHDVRGKPPSLFTANKCLAIAGVFLIGFSLALGPLARISARIERVLAHRRSMGLIGGWLVAAHVIVTVVPLYQTFPLAWYRENWGTPLFAIPSFILIVTVMLISWPWAFRFLGQERWLRWQRLVWPAFLLNLAHLFSMGKIPGWIKWVQVRDAILPPGALTTSVFCIVVLLLGLADRWRGSGAKRSLESWD